MFNTARKLAALLLLLRGINDRLKKIERKLHQYHKKHGNPSAKIDKLSAKLDKVLKKQRGR